MRREAAAHISPSPFASLRLVTPPLLLCRVADHLRPLNPTPYKVSVTETVFRDFHRLWEQSVPIKDISNLNVEADE